MDVQEEGGKAPLRLRELERLLPEHLAQLRLRPHPLGDPEQVEGRLGQARVAAAPERLVAGQRPARQADDRLEDGRHLPRAEQLGQLPRALDELLRQLHVGDGDGGRLEGLLLRLVDLLPPDPELHLREVEDVALAQRRLAQALAVDEGAVLAPEVPDMEDAALQEELGVLLRDRVRGQGQGEAVEPADPERQRLDRDPAQLPSALDEALEVEADRAGLRLWNHARGHGCRKGIIVRR